MSEYVATGGVPIETLCMPELHRHPHLERVAAQLEVELQQRHWSRGRGGRRGDTSC